MANETHKPLVNLATLFKTLSYTCFTLQWPYSTNKLHIATIMTDSLYPCDCVTTVSGQNSQQKRTRAFTKISRHVNSIVHTNIKVVSWVTNYKEHKFSTVMSCLKLYFSHITVLAFFYGMTAPGLLIFEALWSYWGMDYAGLLYM